MAVFVNENTKVVVQGLTGAQGRFYGLRNRAYGTQVVAGTNPKKAGTDVEGIPIFASVADAVQKAGANAAFIIVPELAAAAAVLEAAAAGIPFIVCVTEHIPAKDQAKLYNTLKRDYPNTKMLGPNCAGILTPGKCNIGFTPTEVATPGPVGVVSRSGTLAYQALYELTEAGIGQSTCVGIGGDPVPGTSFIDALQAFQNDPETEAIVMIGEIGGSAEEEAAQYIKANVTKPVVAYVAGITAPAGKKMGHAGAITGPRGAGTAKSKIAALNAVGVAVAENPTQIGQLVKQALKR
jgi:succinyl-CoA synthetase alpha subunit